MFINIQHRFSKKLNRFVKELWVYYKSHDFNPPIPRSKKGVIKHDVHKYGLVEVGVALYETGKIFTPSRKVFMKQWGDIFGVTMHDYEQTLSKLIGRKSTNTPFLEDLIGCFEESANRKLSKRDS